MKSCLYYPVTSNFFSVARFLYNQMALANSYLCSFGGSGLVGKSFEEVYGYNFIDQQVYDDSDLENMVKNVSSVVLLPVEEFYDQDVVKNKLELVRDLAYIYKKEILDYTETNHFPFEVCKNPKGKAIKNISKPVISVGGLIDASRSTEIFLSTLNILRQHNIKVSAFSCYYPTQLLGVHYMGSVKQAGLIEAERYIKSLNSYVIQKVNDDNSDVILIDSPSCFIPYNNLSTSDFGVLAFEIFQAIPSDLLIMSIPLDCTDISFKHSINTLFEQRFGKEPTVIVVENTIINYLEVGRGGGMKKLVVPVSMASSYIKKAPSHENLLKIWDKNLGNQIYNTLSPLLEELI